MCAGVYVCRCVHVCVGMHVFAGLQAMRGKDKHVTISNIKIKKECKEWPEASTATACSNHTVCTHTYTPAHTQMHTHMHTHICMRNTFMCGGCGSSFAFHDYQEAFHSHLSPSPLYT